MLTWLMSGLFLLAASGLSILGQGGAALFTPIQVWLGVDFHTAATTSLFLVMTLSLSSSLVFHKAGKIDWGLAWVLETATVSGGFIGGLESKFFSSAFLSGLFALVVSIAAFFMLRDYKRLNLNPEGHNRFTAWQRSLNGETYRINLAVALPISFLAGLASGLAGIGGGLLKVPMMTLLFGIPMDIAIGSSALMVGLTAAAGFAGHVLNGHWDWKTSLILAAAVFAGGQIGGRVSLKLDKAKLKKGFGWFLLAVAVLMIIKIFI